MNSAVKCDAKSFVEYTSTRKEGDINLIAKVRELLLNAGLKENVAGAYDNHRWIIDGEEKTPNVQQYLLNRYWSQQLLCCPADTVSQRMFLVPDGSPENWLKFFEVSILPFLIEHKLPVDVTK